MRRSRKLTAADCALALVNSSSDDETGSSEDSDSIDSDEEVENNVNEQNDGWNRVVPGSDNFGNFPEFTGSYGFNGIDLPSNIEDVSFFY